ncbi:MAG: OadG family protein [Synergistaceae bacterium]|jgi:Na+-transporting methylmalonyl-CoA/oxaloacetate decarboxylase gamma subunit|nr:OadG family protein [Synergistaceae bacterium]
MEHLSRFQGMGGAFIVSLIAFTIVFIVLAGLTAVIYAIKFFSSEDNKKDSGTPAPVAPVTAAPSASASAGDGRRLTAVIAAAVLAATHGRGRILNITPASSQAAAICFSTWKTSGIMERVGSRLTRTWKPR